MIVLGNKELLDSDLAVILNSSQSKTPCGHDPWILATVGAANDLISRGHALITSIGLPTWELCIHLAAASGGRQVILSPAFDQSDGEEIFRDLLSRFELDEKKTALILVGPDSKGRSPKENWPKRDGEAIRLARIIAPVSIRPGGRLSTLLGSEAARQKIAGEFRVEYRKPLLTTPRYNLSNLIFPETGWNGLTHWTKSCHGPWPGESAASYYSRLLASGDSFPGNAFNTLQNIIHEGRLRASADRIRGGQAVVGFTDVAFAEALGLMRWCPRRVNWNFEPYGVIIAKALAQDLCLRPAIYGRDEDYEALSDDDKPYFQSLGKTAVDWSREKEWRKVGDLDLGTVPDSQVKYIVWKESEAACLREFTDREVIAINKS